MATLKSPSHDTRNDAGSEQDDAHAQLMPTIVTPKGGGGDGTLTTPVSPAGGSPRPSAETMVHSHCACTLFSPQNRPPDKLETELPKLVQSLRQGRVDSFAASAVVTTLFAGIEAALLAGNSPLSNLPDPSGGGTGYRSNARLLEAYLAFAYMSLGLNLGATAASLYLIDVLGGMGFPPKDVDMEKAAERRTARRLLQMFGTDQVAYRRIEFYWLFTFQLGYLSVVVQYGLYIWLHASNVAAALATPTVLIALLPLTFQLFGG